MSVMTALACVMIGCGASEAISQSEGTTEIKMDGLEHVVMETNVGSFMLALDSEKAPITTENFLRYVQDDFYDGTIFHRVIPTFVIQGGGFTEDMVQKDTRTPIKNEWKNGLKNNRGTISMARTGNPDSATSQFFINVKDNAALDMARPQTGNAAYAVFGEVVAGMDVVDTIRDVPTKTQMPTAGGAPMSDVPIETMMIVDAYRVSDEEAENLKGSLEEQNAAMIKAWQAKAAERQSDRLQARRKAQVAEIAKGEKVIEGLGVEIKGAYTTEDGLWIYDEVTGDGDEAVLNDRVDCHYDLYLTNGSLVQSSRTNGSSAQFNLMEGQLIEAWLKGIPNMKIGGTRWLISPPDMAYGSGGRPGIPPNATLVFRVELLDRVAR